MPELFYFKNLYFRKIFANSLKFLSALLRINDIAINKNIEGYTVNLYRVYTTNVQNYLQY